MPDGINGATGTATALMVASFTAGGAVDMIPALAVMLGANVGTTLIVQVLSFDITLIFPFLIFSGYIAYKRGSSSRVKDTPPASRIATDVARTTAGRRVAQ